MRSTLQLPRLLEGPGAIVVNTRARTVEVAAAPVILTRLAFDILSVLLDRRGEVVTHDELAELAWGYEATGHHGAIQTGIYRLRLALKVAGASGVIRAIRGVGYTVDGSPSHKDPLWECSVEAAFPAVPFPTLLVNPAGRLSLANEAAASLTGLEVADLESLTSWLSVLAETSRPVAEASFDAATSGEQPDPIDVSILDVRPNSGRSARLHVAPVSEHGQVIGNLVTLVPA